MLEYLMRLKRSLRGNPMVREITTSIWVNEILLCPENFDLPAVSGGDHIG